MKLSIKEGDAITEKKLKELGYKFRTNFAYEIKVFTKKNETVFWNFKTKKFIEFYRIL